MIDKYSYDTHLIKVFFSEVPSTGKKGRRNRSRSKSAKRIDAKGYSGILPELKKAPEINSSKIQGGIKGKRTNDEVTKIKETCVDKREVKKYDEKTEALKNLIIEAKQTMDYDMNMIQDAETMYYSYLAKKRKVKFRMSLIVRSAAQYSAQY